jgi:hypothetical protein
MVVDPPSVDTNVVASRSGAQLVFTFFFLTNHLVPIHRDVDNMYRFAQGVAREERGKGVNIWLGPMVNIARVPFGGRCLGLSCFFSLFFFCFHYFFYFSLFRLTDIVGAMTVLPLC